MKNIEFEYENLYSNRNDWTMTLSPFFGVVDKPFSNSYYRIGLIILCFKLELRYMK